MTHFYPDYWSSGVPYWIEAREALVGIGGATRIQDAYKRWLKACSGVSTTRKARFSSAGKAAPPARSKERRCPRQPIKENYDHYKRRFSACKQAEKRCTGR